MRYYPVYLDISTRRCVVVGGGEVAERKVERLLECGADVTVVGTELTPGLEAMVASGKICHIPDEYQREYLADSFLVIGATDSENVNEKIYGDSRERGILVNVVDDPSRCDFIVPSVVQQGDLSIAVSTGGKSPALARNLREQLEGMYGPEYGIFLDIMGDIRKRIISRGKTPDDNKKIFESIVESDILRHIREKNWDCVRQIVRDRAGEDIDDSLFRMDG